MEDSADYHSLQRASAESEQPAENVLGELQPEADNIENANSPSTTVIGNLDEEQKSHEHGEMTDSAHKSLNPNAKHSSVKRIEDIAERQAAPQTTTWAESKKTLPYFARTRISRKFRWLPPSEDTQWGIHWYKPTSMVSLALCGLFTALGHHVYNTSLHGSRVGDPEWPQRWGIALAFFIKMVLVDAVKFAYTQNAWVW